MMHFGLLLTLLGFPLLMKTLSSLIIARPIFFLDSTVRFIRFVLVIFSICLVFLALSV